MIHMVQPVHAGNALRLFVQPPPGAARWRILRKGIGTFGNHEDPEALVAYEGDERVIVDVESLPNDIAAFYRPFYTQDGVTWTPGAVVTGTPVATYKEFSADPFGLLRSRLEAGLRIEVERGTFHAELGYVQVFSAPPGMTDDLRFPLVTLHLESVDPAVRGLGEEASFGEFDGIGEEWTDSDGWIDDVEIQVVAWCLNSDERAEMSRALERVIIANLSTFSSKGIDQVEFKRGHVDYLNGEFGAPMYQVVGTFKCIAPVTVGAPVPPIRDIEVQARSTNG